MRLDNHIPNQRRTARKQIWKIQNKSTMPVGKNDANDTESENDDSDEEDEPPIKKE